MAKKTDKVKNCTQTHCPEQTLGTTSIATPTTPRGNPTPRCSNKLRIRSVEVETSAQMPGVTGPPRIQGWRDPHPARGTGTIQYEQCPEQILDTGFTPGTTTPRGSQIPRCSNMPRNRGALKCQDHRGSSTSRRSDTTRISG